MHTFCYLPIRDGDPAYSVFITQSCSLTKCSLLGEFSVGVIMLDNSPLGLNHLTHSGCVSKPQRGAPEPRDGSLISIQFSQNSSASTVSQGLGRGRETLRATSSVCCSGGAQGLHQACLECSPWTRITHITWECVGSAELRSHPRSESEAAF